MLTIIIWFKRPILAFKLFNENFIIQLINDLKLIISSVMGINLWLIPQISEHCPKNIPGR